VQTNQHSPRPRALIVEDEILIAEELKERLTRLGFFVIAAVDSAEEGVAIATSERPDLVLMDIRLKGAKRMSYKPPRRSTAWWMCRLFI
jgi:DNA-binding response OmpR family regulator